MALRFGANLGFQHAPCPCNGGKDTLQVKGVCTTCKRRVERQKARPASFGGFGEMRINIASRLKWTQEPYWRIAKDFGCSVAFVAKVAKEQGMQREGGKA